MTNHGMMPDAPAPDNIARPTHPGLRARAGVARYPAHPVLFTSIVKASSAIASPVSHPYCCFTAVKSPGWHSLLLVGLFNCCSTSLACLAIAGHASEEASSCACLCINGCAAATGAVAAAAAAAAGQLPAGVPRQGAWNNFPDQPSLTVIVVTTSHSSTWQQTQMAPITRKV